MDNCCKFIFYTKMVMMSTATLAGRQMGVMCPPAEALNRIGGDEAGTIAR